MKKIQISISIEKDIWNEMKKIAKTEDRSASGIVRQLIRGYINAHQRATEQVLPRGGAQGSV